MDGELFLRVRGRVLGPYDQDKLQALVRRGQLSRMHELSADGVNWTRASTFADLFVSEPVLSRPVEHESAEPLLVGGQERPQEQWHYSSAGVERGPVDFYNLQMLAGAGQLLPSDMVWTQGMANWLPAQQIPGLLRAAANGEAGGKTDDPNSQKGDLGPAVRAAVSSRPWATFISVMSFVLGALFTFWGILLLMAGARIHSTVGVAMGLFTLIDAVLCVIGGYLLLGYANGLASLHFKQQPGVLARSLDALRAFWVFVSILIIVISAFILFWIIWALAVGATLPRSWGD